MWILRGLASCLLPGALFLAAFYLTGNYEVADRLAGWFVTLQPWLPLSVTFEQFLIALAVAGGLAMVCGVVGVAAAVNLLALRRSARAEGAARTLEAPRTAGPPGPTGDHYDQLVSVGQALVQHLDKRALLEAIVQAASRMTSTAETTSLVSLWLRSFETDAIRFEHGAGCEASWFVQREFQTTQPPFSRVVSARACWSAERPEPDLPLLKPEAVGRLGRAAAMLVVPLVIEGRALGILVVSCHPEILARCRERPMFYEALWGELALALAVAIQGDVAILDRLTGVHNREYFTKRLVQEIERANRYRLPLSLLMIDVDDFKLVNDSFGHLQGDAILKIIAHLVRREVRAIDLVGRYGGDEFIVMLPETGYGSDAASARGAVTVAERMRRVIDEEFRGLQKPLNLTISIGVAMRRLPEGKDIDARELVRLADEQLLQAKMGGKNRVSVTLPKTAQPVP